MREYERAKAKPLNRAELEALDGDRRRGDCGGLCLNWPTIKARAKHSAWPTFPRCCPIGKLIALDYFKATPPHPENGSMPFGNGGAGAASARWQMRGGIGKEVNRSMSTTNGMRA